MHPAPHLSPDPASLTESLSQQDRAADPVKPQDNAASARQEMTTQQGSVDHLAIEEARGENCNRIREILKSKRAGGCA